MKAQIGEIIQDSYRNPAIVVATDAKGTPTVIRQLTGSDRGRITYAPREIVRIIDPAILQWAAKVMNELR